MYTEASNEKKMATLVGIFLNNQPDPLIIQIYSVIKLHMFRASFLPIIRGFLPTIGTGKFHAGL
jgi:hypothetical protein